MKKILLIMIMLISMNIYAYSLDFNRLVKDDDYFEKHCSLFGNFGENKNKDICLKALDERINKTAKDVYNSSKDKINKEILKDSKK